MKLFILVIIAATIIGGFVGGELTDQTFTLTGAVIGGIGLASILLALGAYFDAQEKKKQKNELPPEMRDVFDRMLGKNQNSSANPKKTTSKKTTNNKSDGMQGIEDTIKNLMAQDAEVIARGETPERRLIPHHAIKRDVIIAAYNKDYQMAVNQMQEMDWTKSEKDKRLSEINKDFDKHIYGIKRLGQDDLDKIIALMKKTRTDLVEIEGSVRSGNPMYKIVDPHTKGGRGSQKG